uniref:Nucleoporin Nup133/Nup155-like C-terminal domain-containing protein n=1 Tax=Ciona savignyi TaxID=51511 RepID=H2ZNV7_CIOSA
MDRAGCYKCITDMLEELMLAGESRVQAPSVPTQPGPPTLSVSNNSLTDNLAPEEAQLYAEDCLQLALNSTDELFHTTLYEWMLRRNLTTQLLKVTSPFIEPFLKRVAATQDEAYSASDTLGSDLLWQYFERTGQHLEAAKILTNLAERPGSDRCLAKRIEYLSRAKMNSKCSTSMKSDHSSGQLLQELEEKLEVAQIQLETMEQLREMSEHDSCSKLDFQLMDVTTLYSEFAEPFQLAECKLAIVHCAGLHDPNLVEALWQNIIECELSKSGSSDQNPSVVLQNKVVQLSKRYMASQRYFPIEFLVQLLEKVSSSRSWELTWASNSFLHAGYPLTQLLIIYQKLHSQKLGYWSTMGNSYHLLYVVNEMLNSFLDDPMKHLSNHQQRHPFLNRALDTLAANLVELSSVPSPSDHIRQLIARMRKTQASLENMQHRTR